MGGQPFGRRAFVVGRHFLPQAHTRARVIPGTRCELHPYQIGFGLVFPAEFERGQTGTGLRYRIGDTWIDAEQTCCQRTAHACRKIGGPSFTHSLACVFAQCMGYFVAHDHRHFVVRELQFVEYSGVKRDLAAGHAIGIDLVGAYQIDLPLPLLCARIPLPGKRDDSVHDGAQSLYLRAVGWA